MFMADRAFMYAIVAGAFAVLTGILFSSSAKRKSEESRLLLLLLLEKEKALYKIDAYKLKDRLTGVQP
jgi:hypothetical protein